MDQKHAMLYPQIDSDRQQRISNVASASIGLPVELPPSYDTAVASGPTSLESRYSETAGAAAGPAAPVAAIPAADYPRRSVISPSIYLEELSQTDYPTELEYQQQQFQRQLPNVPPPQPTLKLGPHPSLSKCLTCGLTRTTRVIYTPNVRTHICAVLLCLVGWCCCACVVPYCMNSCRTANHYCSQCNTFLGAHSSYTEEK